MAFFYYLRDREDTILLRFSVREKGEKTGDRPSSAICQAKTKYLIKASKISDCWARKDSTFLCLVVCI